jgi:putative nucleotidyltransferase with HDIG domain
LDWLGSREGHLRVSLPGSSDERGDRRVTLSFEELDRLSAAEGPIVLNDPDQAAGYFDGAPDAGTPGQALMLAPLKLSGGLAGYLAVDSQEAVDYSENERSHFRQIGEQLSVALAKSQLLEELERMSWGALTALARAIDAKSSWTLGHSERVTNLSVALARGMGMDEDTVLDLQRGGLVHDVGKIAVPRTVLDKKGRLMSKEWVVVKSHPEVGVRILEPIPAMEEIIPIVLYHHEDWDGSGYPTGLEGESIPLLARVLAVADRFDALISPRPYRGALPLPEVSKWIREQSGKGLDPQIVEIFLDLLDAGKLPLADYEREEAFV